MSIRVCACRGRLRTGGQDFFRAVRRRGPWPHSHLCKHLGGQMQDTAIIRGWYAEDLRLRSPVLRNLSVVEAFAAVPRERFLGSGPWQILPDVEPRQPFTTPDDAPHWL